jgi:hypothetical protein
MVEGDCLPIGKGDPAIVDGCAHIHCRRKFVVVHDGGMRRRRSSASCEGGRNNRPQPPPCDGSRRPCPSLLAKSGSCHRQRQGKNQRRRRRGRQPGRTIRHGEGAVTQTGTLRRQQLGVEGRVKGGATISFQFNYGGSNPLFCWLASAGPSIAIR